MNGSLFILYLDGGLVYVSKSHNLSVNADLADASIKSPNPEEQFYIWETTDEEWEVADYKWDFVVLSSSGGFSESIPAMRSSTFNAEGLVDFDGDLPRIWNLTNDLWNVADFNWESNTIANIQFNTISQYALYRLPTDFELIYDSGKKFSGSCYLTSVSQTANDNEIVSYSCDFTVDSITSYN